jgi:hypothetical protein
MDFPFRNGFLFVSYLEVPLVGRDDTWRLVMVSSFLWADSHLLDELQALCKYEQVRSKLCPIC